MGGGKKPKAPPPPVLVPPNIKKQNLLLSNEIYEIVDLICEGPIWGFVDQNGQRTSGASVAKSIYLNDTPIQNTDDGSYNFQYFSFDSRQGDANQEVLSVPDNVAREQVYREKLIGPWLWNHPQRSNETVDERVIEQDDYPDKVIKYGEWDQTKLGPNEFPPSNPIAITHVVENVFIDTIRVNFLIEQLYDTIHSVGLVDNNGKTTDTNDLGNKQPAPLSLNVKIYKKLKKGAKILHSDNAISIFGMTEQPYGFSREYELPAREEGDSIIIEVTRQTGESVSPMIRRSVILDSVVEIMSRSPFTYPLSVLNGLKIDARTFSQPPQRSFLIRGKKVRIPSNYYPLSETWEWISGSATKLRPQPDSVTVWDDIVSASEGHLYRINPMTSDFWFDNSKWFGGSGRWVADWKAIDLDGDVQMPDVNDPNYEHYYAVYLTGGGYWANNSFILNSALAFTGTGDYTCATMNLNWVFKYNPKIRFAAMESGVDLYEYGEGSGATHYTGTGFRHVLYASDGSVRIYGPVIDSNLPSETGLWTGYGSWEIYMSPPNKSYQFGSKSGVSYMKVNGDYTGIYSEWTKSFRNNEDVGYSARQLSGIYRAVSGSNTNGNFPYSLSRLRQNQVGEIFVVPIAFKPNDGRGLPFEFNKNNLSPTVNQIFKRYGQDLRRYDYNEYQEHKNGNPIGTVDSGKYQPAHIYKGEWDGTFKMGWTDNPAWILYDLLTDQNYGLGNFIDINLIDKWALYEIGRFCDAVDDAGYFTGVSTISGGLEPRYSCNLLIDQEQNAFDVINFIAGIFRGMVYWSNGSLHFADDRPKEAVMQFGNANVENGEFVYSETTKNARFTVAEVAYNDRDDNYLPKVEYVEDADGIISHGIIKSAVQGFGTTSRSEARRIGLYQLLSSRLESEFVVFKTQAQATYLRPGDVIEISDDLRQTYKYNGIVQNIGYDANTNLISITTDSPLPTGITNHISLVTPWTYNTIEDLNKLESVGLPDVKDRKTKQFTEIPFVNISSDRRTVFINGSYEIYNGHTPTEGDEIAAGGDIPVVKMPMSEFYKNIPQFSLYSVKTVSTTPTKYRVVSILEDSPNIYSVTAIRYNEDKFALIEDEDSLVDLTVPTNPNLPNSLLQPNRINNLSIATGNLVGDKFDLSVGFDPPIQPPNLALGSAFGQPEPYTITMRRPDGSSRSVATSNTNWIFPNETGIGEYSVSVFAVGGAPLHVAGPSVKSSLITINQNYEYGNIFPTGFTAQGVYSSTFQEDLNTGTIYLSNGNLNLFWRLMTPNGPIGGQQVQSSPFGISHDITFMTGGVAVPALSKYNHQSANVLYTYEEIAAACGGNFPRDAKLLIDVSGRKAPDTSKTSFEISLIKPAPSMSQIRVRHELGQDRYLSNGSILRLNNDGISGGINLHIFGDTYGDLRRVNVYTGSSSPITIDDNSLHETFDYNGIDISSDGLEIDFDGLANEIISDGGYSLEPKYNPVYLQVVLEDRIGSGATLFNGDMSGQYAVGEIDPGLGTIWDEMANALNNSKTFMPTAMNNNVIWSEHFEGALQPDVYVLTLPAGIGMNNRAWATASNTQSDFYKFGVRYYNAPTGNGLYIIAPPMIQPQTLRSYTGGNEFMFSRFMFNAASGSAWFMGFMETGASVRLHTLSDKMGVYVNFGDTTATGGKFSIIKTSNSSVEYSGEFDHEIHTGNCYSVELERSGVNSEYAFVNIYAAPHENPNDLTLVATTGVQLPNNHTGKVVPVFCNQNNSFNVGGNQGRIDYDSMMFGQVMPSIASGGDE